MAQNGTVKGKFDEAKITAKLKALGDYDQITNALDSINNLAWKDDFLNTLKKETHGYLQTGYSYGLNTIFRDSNRAIGSILNLHGNVNTQVAKLPVKISFNYSSLKVPLGTNNYFRISYDKEKLQRNKSELLNKQLNQLNDIEKNLLDKKGDLSELQSYLEVYMVSLREKYAKEIRQEASRQLDRKKEALSTKGDSISHALQNRIPDSLSPPNKFVDTLQFNDSLQNTLYHNPKIERARLAKERVEGYYRKIMVLKEKGEELLKEIQQRKEQLSNARNSLNSKQLNVNHHKDIEKVDWLSAIKKVDVGLTYPSTTALSNQTTAVKGIGSEWQINQYYLALSSGLTLNNVMLSTNQLNNELIYNQNVFNQFDFQRVMQNGILTSLKTGWGTPSATHVFLGMNYLTNTRNPQHTQLENAPSVSLELDIRYVPQFIKGAIIDLVYGKTSINRSRDTSDISMFSSLFSNYRSNNYLAKYTQTITKLKSAISFSFRQIDIGVNTNLYGLMQPGNRRLQFESRHSVRSYLKLGTTYKWEESLGTPMKLNLQTVGGTLSGSMTEYISYHFNANFVANTITRVDKIQKGNNFLINAGIQGYKSWGSKRAIFALTYTDFLLADTLDISRFTQIGFQSSLESRSWLLTIGADYFYQNSEIEYSKTTVAHIGAKFKEKKWILDLMLKYAVGQPQSSLGGHVELKWEVAKFLDLQIRAERLVLGNFYRNYYRAYYNQFPYLLSISTKFKI